jgi:hypothetical protein
MDEPVPAVDPAAVRSAAAMTVGPAVFLVHFGAVYGFNALACAFGWSASRVAGVGLVPAFVAIATVAAVALVLLVAHRVPDRSTEGVTDREYDQRARGEFVLKMRVMIAWLAASAMVLVALPVAVTHSCG